MTLDEARTILGVARGASHQEIRDAFRHQARQVHPDTHPTASPQQLAEYSRLFDRAREARDLLSVLPEGTTAPAPSPRSAAPPRSPHRPAPAATPRPRARPTREPAFHSHTRTLRFDEFVRVVDAAGFGSGHRSPLSRAIPRIAALRTVVILTAGAVGSIVWALSALQP